MPPTKSWDSLQTMNEGLKVLKKSTTKSASAGSLDDFLTTRSWINSRRRRCLMLQDGCTLSARSHAHVCVQYITAPQDQSTESMEPKGKGRFVCLVGSIQITHEKL